MTPEMEKSFEEFYQKSPFVDAGDRFKIAMKGAWMAGYIYLGEELKKHL